jgi:hypothetical protein
VIPSNLRNDRFDSGVGAERFDASGLGEEASPRGAGGIDDGVVVIEQAEREETLLEIEPQALDRIEFGAAGRQRQQRDVVGHRQVVGDVPSGLIGEHGHVLVIRDRLREPIEELLHRLGVGTRHHQGEGVIGAGLDGGEDVGEGEAPVAQTRQTLAAPLPDMTDTAHLTDARLVLEQQPDALAFMCIGNLRERLRDSF